MKQLLSLLVLTFLLTSCADKDSTSDATDSASIVTLVDTSINTTSTQADDYDSEDYTNTEIINKPGTITLVTKQTEIFSDSLLKTSSGKSLLIGEDVTIENYSCTTLKNKWKEPVYKIAYGFGSDIEYGYVSQSHIACRLDTLKSKKVVSLTLDYDPSKDKFMGKISLLSQTGKMISNTTVELDIMTEDDAPHSYSYYFSFEENESTGLDGIVESFSISTNYDACGYVGYDYTFLWNEKKLITCPETFGISEADMFHNHSYLIFPSDSLGKKGSILEIIEGDEYGDIQNDNTRTIQKDSTVIDHKWNEKLFTISTGDTLIKKSRTYSLKANY